VDNFVDESGNLAANPRDYWICVKTVKKSPIKKPSKNNMLRRMWCKANIWLRNSAGVDANPRSCE
jgi:hypothetical protein